MQITVNGSVRTVADEPARSLLHVLREELALTQAKYGCGEGACGACTVLVDGKPTHSCVLPLAEVGARGVTTLEGLAADAFARRLTSAFAAEAALQCGYCTPGMLVSATALLYGNSAPDDGQIVAAMDGNICRCGTYPQILRAIRSAALEARTGAAAEQASQVPGAAPEPGSDQFEGAGANPSAVRPKRPWDLTPPEARDWFDLLGEGLIVVLSPEETEKLGEADGRGWSTEGGAWIHVGEDGRVRAFTGKVDVGQGNREALAQVVSGELGTSGADVDLVMGDTDLCPYDIGTFGSRSMADAGTVLRTAAAAARRVLVEEAASRWECAAHDLRLADGVVTTVDGSRSASLGELVRGTRRLELAGAGETLAEVTAASETRARPVRADPVSAHFTTDLARPGMLHGRVLRAPSFGAQLIAVDLSGAQAMPGVVVARDGGFVGVAATDPITAAQALAQIHAEWQEVEQPSESELVPYLRAHLTQVQGWEGGVDRALGNVEKALAGAAVTLSATYTTAYLAHVPLEARVAVAEWQPNGDGSARLTVWTGTQRPFGVREQLAGTLGVDEADIRVIVPPTGSGYGGKHTGEAAVEAARLARVAGRPVKVRWSREEEFSWAYFRPAAVIDIRSGASADGKLVGWDFRNTNSGSHAAGTPYTVRNQRVVFQPAASPLRQGSYRALAATANCFARESHMDELAHRLNADALAFRLDHLDDERLTAAFRAAAEAAGWPGTAGGAAAGEGGGRIGLGIAGGIEKDGRVATCAEVRVAANGRVSVERIVTAYDCGAIVDRENLANQVEGATVMGIGGALFEAIHFEGGRITNGSLSDYRVPRFSDVPRIDVLLLDQPGEPSAGAGETPMIAVAPAIANAIFAATGHRIRSLPLLRPDGTLAG